MNSKESINCIIICCKNLLLPIQSTYISAYYYHKYNLYLQNNQINNNNHTTESHLIIICACIFLSCKVSERLRRIRDVMNAVKEYNGINTEAIEFNNEYLKEKEDIIIKEQEILRAFIFNTEVTLPYLYLFNYSRYYRLNQEEVEKSLSYLNDSMFSLNILTTDPSLLAASCIYLALYVTKSDIMDTLLTNKDSKFIDFSIRDISSTVQWLLNI